MAGTGIPNLGDSHTNPQRIRRKYYDLLGKGQGKSGSYQRSQFNNIRKYGPNCLIEQFTFGKTIRNQHSVRYQNLVEEHLKRIKISLETITHEELLIEIETLNSQKVKIQTCFRNVKQKWRTFGVKPKN